MRYRRSRRQAMMGNTMGHVGPYDTLERPLERNALPNDPRFFNERYMDGTGETVGVWSEVDFESLQEAAQAAFAAGDYDAALALLEEAYELDPSPRHRWNQAVIYVAANEPAAALEILAAYQSVLVELVGAERFDGLYSLAESELPAPPPPAPGFPFIPIAIAGAIVLALRRR